MSLRQYLYEVRNGVLRAEAVHLATFEQPSTLYPLIIHTRCKKHPKRVNLKPPRMRCAGCWLCYIATRSGQWPPPDKWPMRGAVTVEFLAYEPSRKGSK